MITATEARAAKVVSITPKRSEEAFAILVNTCVERHEKVIDEGIKKNMKHCDSYFHKFLDYVAIADFSEVESKAISIIRSHYIGRGFTVNVEETVCDMTEMQILW